MTKFSTNISLMMKYLNVEEKSVTFYVNFLFID